MGIMLDVEAALECSTILVGTSLCLVVMIKVRRVDNILLAY
jgi:hypothetical protein